MASGFPLEKAQTLIASQDDTNEHFFAVRLPYRTLIGAMGVINHPDESIEVSAFSLIEKMPIGERTM